MSASMAATYFLLRFTSRTTATAQTARATALKRQVPAPVSRGILRIANVTETLETLVRDSGVAVTVPHYALAPDHQVDEAYALLDAVYDSIGTERVVLAGSGILC